MRGDSSRNEALQLHEDTKSTFLEQARAIAMRLWNEHQQPLSVEDIRRELTLPKGMEPRVMGAIFHNTRWQAVGYTKARGHCNTRDVKLFIPKQ